MTDCVSILFVFCYVLYPLLVSINSFFHSLFCFVQLLLIFVVRIFSIITLIGIILSFTGSIIIIIDSIYQWLTFPMEIYSYKTPIVLNFSLFLIIPSPVILFL